MKRTIKLVPMRDDSSSTLVVGMGFLSSERSAPAICLAVSRDKSPW